MAGFFRYYCGPAPLSARDHAADLLNLAWQGRRLKRRAVEDLWRLWPDLPADRRASVRALLYHQGVTARLVAAATRGHGPRRATALKRLIALADPESLEPLLAAWDRLRPDERQKILALAGRMEHPGLAVLLWQYVACHAADPPREMARLAETVGPRLLQALGRSLAGSPAPDWAWESLARIGNDEARRELAECLGRGGVLAERSKDYFALASGEVLPLLMSTARTHASWETRIGAVTALLRRKEPEALRFLVELLRDPSWYLEGLGPCPWPKIFGLDGGAENETPAQPAYAARGTDRAARKSLTNHRPAGSG